MELNHDAYLHTADSRFSFDLFRKERVSTGKVKGCALAAFILSAALPVLALDGNVNIHDPSTIMECDGKYYTYGTSGTALVSDDGWTWRTGTRASRTGAAPDVIKLGDKYFQYISHGTMIWSKSLDPDSPDYGWQDGGSDLFTMESEDDFMNPIDPGLLLDPNNGKVWLVYGSYFGYLRIVEIDPKTGLRVDDTYFDVAVNCEAATIIYKDGYYYLLATHGSCCNGANSSYNIRVGRSKKISGPYIDNMGIDMMEGGGKLMCGSRTRLIGPGHFGLIDEGDGVQKFSLHWEADLDRNGNFGTMDILPLLWKDGWPVAGDRVKTGDFEVESVRTGTALAIDVEAVAVSGRGGRGGGFGGFGGGAPGGGAAANNVVPDQDVDVVSANWPEGEIDIRMGIYMCQAQQKWNISPAEGAGGYLGEPYFKITVAGTDRALAATEGGELVSVPSFTGAPEQLWRIDQLSDGTWRIMPKSIPGTDEKMALSAIGSSSATLEKYDPSSEKQRWIFNAP
ncbi:MAG: family 43 glycosylhydrolase [Pontiellaceae bacterium]|nr:family 43 glycosylhydrolase [Pontiellaceae bacterium]